MSTAPPLPRKPWRAARAVLYVVLCLVTAGTAFYIFEGWRGRRAWAQYRAQAQARGIKLDWQDYSAPELPAENNFAALPLFAGLVPTPAAPSLQPSADPFTPPDTTARLPKSIQLFGKNIPSEQEWRAWQRYFEAAKMAAGGEADPVRAVLASLERFRPALDQMSEGTKRAGAKFPDDGWHISSMIRGQLWWWLRAKAELANGDPARAYEDLSALLRLRWVLEPEPGRFCVLVRGNALRFACDLVCDALSRGGWSNAQLEDLQKHFGEPRLIEDV